MSKDQAKQDRELLERWKIAKTLTHRMSKEDLEIHNGVQDLLQAQARECRRKIVEELAENYRNGWNEDLSKLENWLIENHGEPFNLTGEINDEDN